MVGWDEIRQGGLSETAIVLSRKREQGLRSALENGNDVIMTPYLNCYFDYYQGSRETEPLAFGGFLPLRTAYDLDPFEGRAVAPDSGRAVQPVDRIRCDARPCRVYVAAPIGGFRRTGLDGRRRELSRFPEAFGVVLAAVRRAGLRVSGFPAGSR